jgi:hypothetical protein
MPVDARDDYMRRMGAFFKSVSSHSWRVVRNGEEFRENATLEDIPLMLGYDAAEVLEAKDLWDFQKFGFRSLTDMVGCIGALVINESMGNYNEGYKWITTASDGTVRENHITGDMHCDLRILQTDRTPYETADPIGNAVSYRPELNFDEANVIGYHSTEPNFLAAVLTWIDQHKIKSKTLEDKAKGAIEFARSLGQTIGPTAEAVGGGTFHVTQDYMACQYPLPIIDEKNLTAPYTPHGISTNHATTYGIYTNKEGELLFVNFPREGKGMLQLRSRFSPSEADHLVKGVLYQAAKGLGRTSARELIAGLEYRFSPQYEEDIKES